jgi:hypothetical protein
LRNHGVHVGLQIRFEQIKHLNGSAEFVNHNSNDSGVQKSQILRNWLSHLFIHFEGLSFLRLEYVLKVLKYHWSSAGLLGGQCEVRGFSA